MLVLLSPAKDLAGNPVVPAEIIRRLPAFLSQSQQLITALRGKKIPELRQLMGISENLAQVNYERYRLWHRDYDPAVAIPSAYLFNGALYQSLQMNQFTATELSSVDARIRILSGLYGLLAPFDAILPYRLEMSTRLATKKGSNLYEFWGSTLTKAVKKQAAMLEAQGIINLASQEYVKVINPALLGWPMISPQFLETGEDGPRMVSFFAKKARGTMARWLVTENILVPEQLPTFSLDGYRYHAGRSTLSVPVFIR